jgi:iron complex outermembrane receptor protein
VIDATNVYNPFGVTLDSSNYSFIGRRMVEAGPRHFEQEVQTWDVAATLEGQWNLFGRDWYWDANASWGDNVAAQAFTGDVNVAGQWTREAIDINSGSLTIVGNVTITNTGSVATPT